MTRVLLAVAAFGLLAYWVLAEWAAHAAARDFDRAAAQAEAMSAHPSRWAPGLPPVEDRADYP